MWQSVIPFWKRIPTAATQPRNDRVSELHDIDRKIPFLSFRYVGVPDKSFAF